MEYRDSSILWLHLLVGAVRAVGGDQRQWYQVGAALVLAIGYVVIYSLPPTE